MGIAIRTAIIIPFVIILVVFTASNQDTQDIWLFNYSWKCSVGIIALVWASIAFCTGSLCLWLSEMKQRRRARRAEQELRSLRKRFEQPEATVPKSEAPAVAQTSPQRGEEPVIVPPTKVDKTVDKDK